MLRTLGTLALRLAAGRESLLLEGRIFTHHAAQQAEASSQRHSAAVPAAAAAETLTIDRSAANRLKKLQAETPGTPVALRIEVEGGGCSGFHYKFDLEAKQPNPDDIVFELDGTKVVCDASSFEYLKGSKIEFEESLLKSAFVVSANPNAEQTCGCGTSFALKMK